MNARDRAASKMIEILDSPFLRALAEPARLEVLRVLIAHGPADIGAIAERLPQDRSVISRHLKVLEDASIVRGHRDGRHRIYALDGGTLVGTLERILAETRAVADVCCPPIDVPASRLRKR
ncbi:MAG: winged helix-turn-helix transcriptional regulator [Polyangiaceae bacterium]|nr:winged helix-turn-helix transcriptional regulator [Polyangiaceae bacterium]